MSFRGDGIALLVFVGILAGCAPGPLQAPPIVADVGFDGLTLVLLNRDVRAWDDCTLVIDPGGYAAPVPHVAAGSSARVPAGAFANADGQRFNPYTQKPVTFTLRAAVDGHQQTWTTAFRYDR